MDIVWMWVTPRENKGVLRSIRANCRSSSNSYCSTWVFKPWKCFVNSLPPLEKILTPHWVEMWTQVKIPTVKMPRRSSKVFRLNWAPLLSVSFNLINQDINPFLHFSPQPQYSTASSTTSNLAFYYHTSSMVPIGHTFFQRHLYHVEIVTRIFVISQTD